MTELEITEKVEYLRGVSDVVNQYADSQIYVMELMQDSQDEEGYRLGEASDRVDYRGLMQRCYGIILGELRELGIFLNADPEDVLSNTYDADGCVALYQMLNMDYLKQLFSLYTEYKEPIANIFEPALDKDRGNDELTHIQAFLELYEVLFPNDPYIEQVERVSDLLYSNEFFKEHILAILDSAIPESVISPESAVKMVRYIRGIYEGKQIFTKIIVKLLEMHPEMFARYMSMLMQDCEQYDREKILGTDVAKYYYAVTNEKNPNLSEQEKALVETILSKHKTGQPHHIEYYQANKLHPKPHQLLELTVHHAEPGSNVDNFRKDVAEMIESGKDVFTEEDITTINQYADMILQIWPEPVENE